MASNLQEVHSSFAQQAETFDTTPMNVQRRQHMAHVIDLLSPLNHVSALEVAAGTCACGRALAETAAAVTCLDTTPEMLSVGRDEAQKANLSNMVFVLGDATALPFPDAAFDLAFCRLAFHHIPEYETVFSEMVRVLRPGGRLVLIDLAAPEEPLRPMKEHIELIRDPSHARTLSEAELSALFTQARLTITTQELTDLDVRLEEWLDVTKNDAAVADEIRERMRTELAGGEKTGFSPYEKDGELMFPQHWLTLIGEKK